MFTNLCRMSAWIAVALLAAVTGFAATPVEPGPPVMEPEETLFTEGFEGATPPALPVNWEGPMFGSLWQTATSASNPVAVTPRTGSNMLVLSGNTLQYVWNTTAYDCTNFKDLKIRFWMHQDPSAGSDYAFGAATTLAPGGSIGYLNETIQRQAGTEGWGFYEGELQEYTWYSNSVWVGIGCFVQGGKTVCFDDVTLVGSPAPPPCVPTEGTTGTTFIMERNGFGRDGGKVSFVNAKASLKVLDWSDTTITCLVSKAPPSGVYDVSVQPKYEQAKVYTAAFTVSPPEIDTVTPDNGGVGTPVTVTGSFFTAKRGKLYLVGSGPKGLLAKSCKPATWTMDPATGASSATFLVPKGLAAGVYDLKLLVKGMPEVIVDDAFTVP